MYRKGNPRENLGTLLVFYAFEMLTVHWIVVHRGPQKNVRLYLGLLLCTFFMAHSVYI